MRPATSCTSEGGAHAALGGRADHWRCAGARGQFTPTTCAPRFRPRTRYAPPQRLLEVEQTANIGGGTVWPLAQLDAVAAVARGKGWSTHMDGARLMNACVAAGVAAQGHGRGLRFGLARLHQGPRRAARRRARRHARFHRRGLALEAAARRRRCARPASAAAGCLYALDHNVDRLAEDHANAKALARGLKQIPGVTVEEPETNLVFFDSRAAGIDVGNAGRRSCEARGILVSQFGGRIRACTHLDVTAAMIEETVAAVREIVGKT